tara:strand:+ start:296 stop:1597 length:1302 start_codon:yes stop_codon:yes gene_type:complete
MATNYNPRIVTDSLTTLIDPHINKGFGSDDHTKAPMRVVNNPGNRVAGEDVIVKHSQGPFPGAGYVDFDGSNDYLSISSDLSQTGEFTIEFWFYANTINTVDTLFVWGNDAANKNPARFVSTTSFGIYKYGIGKILETGTNTVQAGKWYHIAVTRNSSNSLRLWLDGVLSDSYTLTDTFGNSGGQTIGADESGSNQFDGYISNFRCVSSCLYTAAFTPLTEPLTAVTDTKLLTCQKGTITDASSSGHSITVNGNAAAVYPSLGSYVFDGNQGSLDQKIQFSSPLFNSNQNFTLDVWFQGEKDLISNNSGAGMSLNVGTSVMIQEPYGGGQLTYASSVLSTNQIHNVVITRNGTSTTSFSIFVDGEQVSTNNINNGGAEIFTYHPNVIGSRYNGTGTPWNHFQGNLYYMSAYQRVLTDSELKQNFNALRGRFGI